MSLIKWCYKIYDQKEQTCPRFPSLSFPSHSFPLSSPWKQLVSPLVAASFVSKFSHHTIMLMYLHF